MEPASHTTKNVLGRFSPRPSIPSLGFLRFIPVIPPELKFEMWKQPLPEPDKSLNLHN